MNVVVINDHAFVSGGAAQVALGEACSLADAGHQVHLVCGVGPAAPMLQARPNLHLHCLDVQDINQDPNRVRALTFGWWNPRTYRYVQSLLASLPPNDTVVHIHSWSRALSPSVLRAATERATGVVVTLHDFLLACPNGTFFLQDTQQKCTLDPMGAACLKRNCDVKSYHHKLWRVGRKLVQTNLGHMPSGVRHFIYSSQLSLDLLRPYLPPHAEFHPLPNAIEIPRSAPADVAAHETFLFVGRLVPEKGVEIFAGAAAAEQVPCRFIGSGPAEGVIARANPNAILSGWMTQADAHAAFQSCRALVFPSLWYETLGLVVLEAAGAGLPAIVPDDCAARESVIDGVTGLYFRGGDEKDLARKIAILRDPAVAASMGRAAYDRFWRAPGMGTHVHIARLESIYGHILQSTSGHILQSTSALTASA